MTKKLIDITDEDALKVVNSIHILTENTLIKRKGILGLSFEESHRKYGSASIEFETASIDRVTDGHFTSMGKVEMVFSHSQVWFAEYHFNEDSNRNSNHFIGYLKLQELGYFVPTTPQI